MSGKSALCCLSLTALEWNRKPDGAIMPHYTFHCEDCGKEFELVLHIADLEKGTVQCPDCKSKKVAQLTAAFSAVTSKKS